VSSDPTLTSPSSPLGGPSGAFAPDPELISLPAPPKRERTIAVVLMVVTAVAAALLALSLRGEARYAMSPGEPVDVGELATLQASPDLANRYVRAEGLLGTTGAIKYGRAAEGDSFRLAPVAGNPKIWVEIRVPEGFEGARFVPPTTFAGRLVPFKRAGVRHVGLVRSVKEQTDVVVPDDAWILVDASSPRASRWALALVALFAGFAAWNVAAIAKMLSRVRDTRGGASK
jgi:hypothetical protein